MSQVVATHPTSFFDKSREFGYQNQFPSDKDAFSLQHNNAEIKQYTYDSAALEGHGHGKHASYNSFYQYSMPMYNMYSNGHTSFSTKFPRVKDYLSKEAMLETFPHLEGVNDLGFDIDSISENAHFYIMRSSNDDNIHKAIKYHMWSTTASGKNTLSTAWQEAEKEGVAPEIYLIFSVVNSNHILGVAKMTSDINQKESFMYWWEPLKWFGSFQLKWIFIKDIPSTKVEHIKEAVFGQTPFINLKDNTRLSVETGKELLTIFKEYTPKSNIFESFAYMDQREDYIRLQRDNNTYFLKYFEEYCNAYQTNPERFSPGKKSHHYKRGGRYNNYNNNNNYYQRRQGGNTYYRKSYHNDRQPNSPEAYNHNNNHTVTRLVKGKPYQPKEEEFPVVSVAQQFDMNVSGKKLKSLREKKSEKQGEEKTDEVKN